MCRRPPCLRLRQSVGHALSAPRLGHVAALLVAIVSHRSLAQDPQPTRTSAATSADSPDPAKPYWSQTSNRLFLSGRALAGLGYGRLALNAGYGKPHFIWAGPEAIGSATPYFASVQAGVQLSVAVANLSVAVRHTESFSHDIMTKTDSVSSSDLDRGDERARYGVVDASMWGFIPYRPWLISWEATYVKPIDLAEDTLVYEEVQRVVVTRRGVFTTKLSPMVSLLPSNRLYAGVLGEHLSLLGRAEPSVLRFGPSAWVKLTDHLEICTYLSWPVVGPDHLGFWNGMYGTVAVLYRFATGDPWSKFP